jgi:hypothetical protein
MAKLKHIKQGNFLADIRILDFISCINMVGLAQNEGKLCKKSVGEIPLQALCWFHTWTLLQIDDCGYPATLPEKNKFRQCCRL